jgi:broad-specificity NMP kinase
MRIIVDGNDGVGKTTLAKRLQQDFNIKSYIHLSMHDRRDGDFYQTLLDKKDAIFDRSFMDDPIYSFVLDRDPGFSVVYEKMLHNYIKKENIVVIICHSEDKIYKDDEEESIITFDKVIDEYFRIIAEDYDYIYFDPKKDSYDKLVKKIKELA